MALMDTEDLILSRYTAEQAVADGQLFVLPRRFTKARGFRVPIRVTLGVWSWFNAAGELYDERGRPVPIERTGLARSRMLRMLDRFMMVGAQLRGEDWFCRFELACRWRGQVWVEDFWAMIDETSGRALHIMRPDEY